MLPKKLKRLPKPEKVKSQRARFFLTHAKEEEQLAKYASAEKFFAGFKPSLYRTRSRTFMIDLRRGLPPTPISIALLFNQGLRGKETATAYEARIRFRGKKIIVESIQGSKNLVEIRDFENASGLPASRFLLREILAQAKNKGYTQILLRRPETHPSYKNPAWSLSLDKRGKLLHEKVMFGEASEAEKKEFEQHKTEALALIRARMKKLYETVAIAEKMKREGDYFVKSI